MQGLSFKMEFPSREEVCHVEIRHSSPEGTWNVFEGMEKKIVQSMVDQTGQAHRHNRDERMC